MTAPPTSPPPTSPPTHTPPPRVSRRPPMFPVPEFPPRRPALFASTPPAVFSVLLGSLGLGLALRAGLEALQLPGGLAELWLGAAGALWLFAVLAYGVKLARRPGVLAEDLRVLPGRGGVAAASVGGMALAAALAPVAPRLAGGLLIVALAGHMAQAVALTAVLRGMPVAARGVNPALHLAFVGPIVGAYAAVELGWMALAVALFWATLPVAGLIWALSARQFAREVPPAPLRPMLAIHLASASVLATVAVQTGLGGLAVGLAVLGGLYLLALLGAARWLLGTGFSAIWGSLTFPVAAYAGALFSLGWVWLGVIMLILALGLVPWITYRILQMWVAGSLAQRTNAAVA